MYGIITTIPGVLKSGLFAIAAVGLFYYTKCNAVMGEDFCNALSGNNRRVLQQQTDSFLRTLNAGANQQANIAAIIQWLSSHPCVSQVEAGHGMLRSDPPVKEFFVTMKDSPGGNVTIGVEFAPDKLRFHTK